MDAQHVLGWRKKASSTQRNQRQAGARKGNGRHVRVTGLRNTGRATMKKTILVVEDEPDLAQIVAYNQA